jgi:hypothetical protein
MRLIALYARFSVFIVHFFLNQAASRRKQLVIASAGLSILVFFPVFYFWIDFQSVRDLKSYTPPVPSRLLDRKGRLISTFFTDNRVMVRSSCSSYQRLYRHGGQSVLLSSWY